LEIVVVRPPAIRELSGSQELFADDGQWRSQELAILTSSHPEGRFPALGDPLDGDHEYQNNKVEMIGLSIKNEHIGQNQAVRRGLLPFRY
jgi:hypothetical protein